MSQMTEVGRTRLHTRRERQRRGAALAAATAGAVAAAWLGAAVASWLAGRGFAFPTLTLRPFTTPPDLDAAGGDAVGSAGGGDGGLLGLPRSGRPPAAPGRAQFPLALRWSASPIVTAVLALPVWLVWVRGVVVVVLRGLREEPRHRGLAGAGAIRGALGVRAARRAGRFTLPATSSLRRVTLPGAAFGYRLGHPLPGAAPRAARWWLWADWEQRVRVIARPGWGKTFRLLVPIIRDLPGPALVSSTEPAIFTQTVTARRFRRAPLRPRLLAALLRGRIPLREYPIAVVDFSAAEHRYTAGYRRVRWNPITGCEDFVIAYRRAAALVGGVETDSGAARGESDRFFRDSAGEVLAAWLHAAALGRLDVEDLLRWLAKPTDPVPARILADDRRADPSALLNLRTHLDPKAARTTSGVQRYLILALNSLASTDGRELCGPRIDPITGAAAPQFDMVGFLMTGGTVYVLAEPGRVERARPLLSLFAAEMFLAAETLALNSPGTRLSPPFIAVLDELRYGVQVPNLPYVANALRKYGVGYVYAVQSSSQEDTVFGPDAASLRAAAGVSIYGGIDIDSAHEITERAGLTPVVTATRGSQERHSENIHLQDTWTVGDQQQLADGFATVIVRGLAPFRAYMPSTFERRRLHRAIADEATLVDRDISSAREAERATHHLHATATTTGADFGQEGSPRT